MKFKWLCVVGGLFISSSLFSMKDGNDARKRKVDNAQNILVRKDDSRERREDVKPEGQGIRAVELKVIDEGYERHELLRCCFITYYVCCALGCSACVGMVYNQEAWEEI